MEVKILINSLLIILIVYIILDNIPYRYRFGVEKRIQHNRFTEKFNRNENILNAKRQLPSEYGIDPNLGPLVSGTGETSDSYPLYEIVNNSGTVLPSIGLLVEF